MLIAKHHHKLICGTDVFLISPKGIDVSPRIQKERALLALLALSPQRKRSRLWLQEKLWSESPSPRGAGSLRRALANIKVIARQTQPFIESDKYSIWLTPRILIERPALDTPEEFLSGLSFEEGDFETWRRHQISSAQITVGTSIQPSAPPRKDKVRILIRGHCQITDGYEAGIVHALEVILSERFAAQGVVVVAEADHVSQKPDLTCDLDSHIVGTEIIIHVRCYAGTQNYFLWSGRTKIPSGIQSDKDFLALHHFANVVFSAIVERGHKNYRTDTFFQLNHAASLLFSGQKGRIMSADEIFSGLLDGGGGNALVYGWRAFQRVTQQIEFPTGSADVAEEGLQFAKDALSGGTNNPTATALAAQAVLKLSGDVDWADHLAQRALALEDTNPYALNIAGHISTLLGKYQSSYELSSAAASAARGLPNEFIWDMQLALASLGTGRLGEAFQSAKRSHYANGYYRPALRYLVALSILLGRDADAKRFEARLKDIEPGFERGHLFRPDYPVDTLRSLGLLDLL